MKDMKVVAGQMNRKQKIALEWLYDGSPDHPSPSAIDWCIQNGLGTKVGHTVDISDLGKQVLEFLKGTNLPKIE
jgi:hypothetical protein